MVRPLTTATRHHKVSDQEIQDIVIAASLTPGKCLSFKTPFQVVLEKFGKDVQSGLLPFAFFTHIRPCERSADYWWKLPKRSDRQPSARLYESVAFCRKPVREAVNATSTQGSGASFVPSIPPKPITSTNAHGIGPTRIVKGGKKMW